MKRVMMGSRKDWETNLHLPRYTDELTGTVHMPRREPYGTFFLQRRNYEFLEQCQKEGEGSCYPMLNQFWRLMYEEAV